MEERWEAIVVGAGFAGGIAALRLARAGVRTVWLERGPRVDGMGHPSGIVPESDLRAALGEDDHRDFPRERRIVDRRLAFLGPEGAVSFEYRAGSPGDGGAPRGSRTTIRRDRTDPWLAERAQHAGARLVTDRRVDGWLREPDGSVAGVRAGNESFRAPVTILATGSAVVAGASPMETASPRDGVAVAEDLYRIPGDRLDTRFATRPEEGVAMGCVLRSEPDGTSAQGYLFLHRDSLSAGVLRTGDLAADSGPRVEETLEAFLRHPAIAPKVRDADRAQRAVVHRTASRGPSGRLSEGGILRVGIAAGLWAAGPAGLVELGFAAESARLAAEAAHDAIRAGDVSPRRLRAYDERVAASGLRARVDLARADGERLMAPSRFRTMYPRFLEEAFHRIMTDVEGPKRPISESVRAARRATGLSWAELARDAAETGRRL